MGLDAQKIPEGVLTNWQNTVNVMAEIFDVPAGLIMRVLPSQIEVLVSSQRQGNPYHPGEKAELNTGLYCETVMATRAALEVPNALEDEHWRNNPDVALNMIAYLGVPLVLPDQQVFGTICVLDSKTRQFNAKYVELLWEIKRGIERDFQLVAQQQELQARNTELTEAIARQRSDAVTLQRTNEQLSEALNTLTALQADLLRSAKHAALGSLVAGVSHELSTPIGNGLMVATTLQDRAKEFSAQLERGVNGSDVRGFAKGVGDGMEMLSRSLDRSVQLVESFRRITVDHSSMSLRTFNLHATVDAAVAGVAARDSRFQIVNTVHANIVMESYVGVMADVVTELVTNALRHAFVGREEGTVTIAARWLEDHSVQLRVRDDGIGIRPEDIELIFDPFFTTQLGQGSSGLGLYTAYNLVSSAMHGNIEVESTPGNGACFTLTLPQKAH